MADLRRRPLSGWPEHAMAHRVIKRNSGRVQQSRGEQAAARGQEAGRRAEDLRQRLAQLRARSTNTTYDVDLARNGTEVARYLAEEARDHARAAYISAAQAHRRTGALLEAMGDSPRAEEHWRAARADDAAAATFVGTLPVAVPLP